MSKPVSKTLLIPVDGSKESTAAFDYACENSTPEDKLFLFHGQSEDLYTLNGAGDMLVAPQKNENAVRHAKRLQEYFMARCAEKNRQCEWIIQPYVGGANKVAQEIVKASTNHKAHQIVMGARGLSRLDTVMLGSVSQAVLHHARIPVTIVKEHTEY